MQNPCQDYKRKGFHKILNRIFLRTVLTTFADKNGKDPTQFLPEFHRLLARIFNKCSA